jgi:hypothetical protein
VRKRDDFRWFGDATINISKEILSSEIWYHLRFPGEKIVMVKFDYDNGKQGDDRGVGWCCRGISGRDF